MSNGPSPKNPVLDMQRCDSGSVPDPTALGSVERPLVLAASGRFPVYRGLRHPARIRDSPPKWGRRRGCLLIFAACNACKVRRTTYAYSTYRLPPLRSHADNRDGHHHKASGVDLGFIEGGDAGLNPTDIQTIFFTGGSSRVPAVRAAISRTASEAQPATGSDLLSVALGLTREAERRGEQQSAGFVHRQDEY